MFALTADQRASRRGADLVPAAINTLKRDFGSGLLLPPDQNAGDEIQAITPDPTDLLDMVLTLTRTGNWSVGIGIGTIERPLPRATRMVRGTALVEARAAVERAKRHPTHVALESATPGTLAEDATAWIRLLVSLRDKRSTLGWELFDLIGSGLNQKEAAERLGVTPQAVGNRMSAAAIRVEQEARASVVRALHAADDEAQDLAKGSVR